jgi:hypothetical protein
MGHAGPGNSSKIIPVTLAEATSRPRLHIAQHPVGGDLNDLSNGVLCSRAHPAFAVAQAAARAPSSAYDSPTSSPI